MRRALALPLLFLVACKKDPPAPTSAPAGGDSASTTTSAAAPTPTVSVAIPAAALTARFTGEKLGVYPLDQGGMLIRQDDIFYSLDETGLHQLKDLLRGTKGKSADLTFLGSYPDCFFVAGNSQNEGEYRNIWATFRRSGDFWGETSYSGDAFLSGAVPVGQGRWVGLLASPGSDRSIMEHPLDSALVLACGKGPLALPTLAAPVPVAAPASASASAAPSPAPSPRAPASAAPSASAASSAAGSASPSASAAPPPVPEAPPPAPEAHDDKPARCPKREHPRFTVAMSRQLASSPAGDLFLIGRECMEEYTPKTNELAVVERWKAGSRQSVVDVLPEQGTQSAAVRLIVQSTDTALVYGSILGSGGESAYLALFDGTTWTHELPPAKARLTSAAYDKHGQIWVVNGDNEVWQRTAPKQWTKIALPAGSGKALAVASFGAQLWVITDTAILGDGAPQPAVKLDKILVDKIKDSDYWDFSMGPVCTTPYVKVGPVKNPKADLEKEFPGLTELAKTNGGATEAIWEDRGGVQWLGLRAKSRDAADKIVKAIVAADGKSKAKAICNDPRGAFVKKKLALEP